MKIDIWSDIVCPFCYIGRTHLEKAIEAFELPYEVDGDRRWHLVGARAVSGMAEISPGLVFSHHVSDPAWGRACSAFDLVRLHRYGELDEDGFIEVVCPHCGETVYFDEEMIDSDDGLICPNCNETIEFEIPGIDGNDVD